MKITRSHLLSPSAFASLQIGATVLEQDERGVKVLLLTNGQIFKIFRLRGTFTSSLIYSNARSFCRNAGRLQKFGVPTVSILRLYHFSDSRDTAVLYEPLVGDTIKSLLCKNQMSDDVCVKLGQFFAALHQLGVHFRSLHFGNIVLNSAGELGLIDIADMRIYPWRLQVHTRLRAFKRFLRYREEMDLLGKKRWQLVVNTYLTQSQLLAKQDKFSIVTA